MTKINKATASAITGALMTVVAVFVELDAEFVAAIQTVVATALVWFVTNKTKE